MKKSPILFVKNLSNGSGELEALKEVWILHWINITPYATKKFFIHTFCDAGRDAYTAVSYLVQEGDDKNVHFLASRSRIAPLKGAMIPRLELLSALVRGRLTKSIVDVLGWTTVKCFYWSHSTNVLKWITKEENWSVFVNNRVQEIRKISQPSSWRNVSGVENQADLPSRGRKASYLVKTRFWEGLRCFISFQDKGPYNDFKLDEDEILKK
ncbi:hypothetical protein AVEN_222115-1 [Araneus ventricosus]|uniref:Uncharacterized protein n=1 Tax=Araneus ventricosus TaxID=182803 RepID=A0A4Y2DXP8_ARAVE|nr:hypothetical protein AVEN_222115-1 [Araneus ventricosus]